MLVFRSTRSSGKIVKSCYNDIRGPFLFLDMIRYDETLEFVTGTLRWAKLFGIKYSYQKKKKKEKRIQKMYVVDSISFQTFLVQAFEFVIDSWKFSMLLLYILWDDGPIFMISDSNEQLHQHSKMQSGHEDPLEERYAIKFCFKLGKNATEPYGMLQTAFGASCMNRA